MKTMMTLLPVMVMSWLCVPGCASDPEPATGEAVAPLIANPLIANPCSFASNGVYCGAALPSPPVGIIANHLYTCVAEADVEEKNCPSSCAIQAPMVPDRCNPDPCAHASDGAFCGPSTQLGFSAASASSYVLYTCSGGRTAASQFCGHVCVPQAARTPDHC